MIELEVGEEQYWKIMGRLSFFWRSRHGRTFVNWTDYKEAILR